MRRSQHQGAQLGLLPQLRLHAPYIAEFATLPTTNTQQQISDSMDNTVPALPYNTTLAVVRATKSYTRAAAFYSFAARVASARESYARRCLSSTGCGIGGACQVKPTSRERAIFAQQTAEQCSPWWSTR